MTANWTRANVLAVVDAAISAPDRDVFVSKSGHVMTPKRGLTASRGAPPKGYQLWADVPEIRAALAEMGFHPERGVSMLRIELGKRAFRDEKAREHARLRLATMLDSADTEDRVAKARARKRRRSKRKAVTASTGAQRSENPRVTGSAPWKVRQPNAWSWPQVEQQRSRKSKRDFRPGRR